MTDVRSVPAEQKASWNAYVDREPFSIAWQVYEWSTVVSRHYDYHFHPLAAYRNGTIVGVLPLYSGSIGRGPGFISVPFAVAGGIVGEDDEARAALLEKASKMSREASGLPVVLKQYKVKVAGDVRTDDTYFNQELSLDPDTETLRKRVSLENVTRAERAMAMGLEVEWPASDTSVFYRILVRDLTAQGIPCAPEGWIRSLIDFGMYSVALGRIRGRVVTATMVKQFKKTVSFPFSCVAVGHPDAQTAAFGLYWTLIRRFSEAGMEIFHSGRLSSLGASALYRLGWGGTPYPYFYQYFPRDVEFSESGRRGGLKRKVASALWKRLPLRVARIVGPRLVKRFP